MPRYLRNGVIYFVNNFFSFGSFVYLLCKQFFQFWFVRNPLHSVLYLRHLFLYNIKRRINNERSIHISCILCNIVTCRRIIWRNRPYGARKQQIPQQIDNGGNFQMKKIFFLALGALLSFTHAQ